MTDVLAKIPLLGWGPLITVAAITVSCLIIVFLLWRKHKVWSSLFIALFLVFGVSTAAAAVNMHFAYYDNAADLLGMPTYPTITGNVSGPDVKPQPNGATTQITVPDTASKFGTYQAQVWLPPQYFTNTRQHFPVVYLLHGNPGQPTDWLTSAGGAATFLNVANSGHPAIIVMPEDIQNNISGDSLCVDSASQGNAETYITKDVIAAIDQNFRTITNAKGRAVGGLSMGGFCALNLGLKNPDLYSVVIDLSGETASEPDTLPGGNQALYGGRTGRRRPTRTAPASTCRRSTAARARRSTWAAAPVTRRSSLRCRRPAQAPGPRVHGRVPTASRSARVTPTGAPASRTHCPGRCRSSVRPPDRQYDSPGQGIAHPAAPLTPP